MSTRRRTVCQSSFTISESIDCLSVRCHDRSFVAANVDHQRLFRTRVVSCILLVVCWSVVLRQIQYVLCGSFGWLRFLPLLFGCASSRVCTFSFVKQSYTLFLRETITYAAVFAPCSRCRILLLALCMILCRHRQGCRPHPRRDAIDAVQKCRRGVCRHASADIGRGDAILQGEQHESAHRSETNHRHRTTCRVNMRLNSQVRCRYGIIGCYHICVSLLLNSDEWPFCVPSVCTNRLHVSGKPSKRCTVYFKGSWVPGPFVD